MTNTMDFKQIPIDDYKQLLVEMLNDFHSICMNNHLKYFVAFGTMIGAVRHNGFIPWDDDIDVCMPRKDYEILLKLLEDSKGSYYMLSSANSKYYYNNFSRFCSRKGILKLKGVVDIDNLGPFIDVIPLDKVPDNQIERAKYYKKVRSYFRSIRYSLPFRYYQTLAWKGQIRMQMNIPKKIYTRFFIGIEKLKKERDNYIMKYRDIDTGLLCATFDQQSDKLLVYEKEIEHLILHQFENIEVLIPSEYDAILTRTYGDYMKLPPKEMQVAHHHFIPFWE